MDFYSLSNDDIESLINEYTDDEHLRTLLRLRIINAYTYDEMPLTYQDLRKRNGFMSKCAHFLQFASEKIKKEDYHG